ncbi:MAG: methyltransferase [Bacteroidota bacterium]
MNQELNIERFPPSSNRSLKAFSAADESILAHTLELSPSLSSVTIINDRFGFLALQLMALRPHLITHHKSQEEAIRYNYELNGLALESPNFFHLLSNDIGQTDLILMKVPKSLDLFHLFLMEAHSLSKPTSKVLCGFMTRHFTKQLLDLASLYFEEVEQSKAWKKSRILTLSNPRCEIKKIIPLHLVPFQNPRGEEVMFKQYFGVFSAKHIDFATQFLLHHLEIDPKTKTALDLASGNGVIAYEIKQQAKHAEIHLLDDSFLAIESSKLNLQEGNIHFHYNYEMSALKDGYFDVIVCNPPFHFEHENTIEIALKLFEGVSRTLSPKGLFLVVSNLHLNYKVHLRKYFRQISQKKQNSKFEIIECSQPVSRIK